MSASETIYLPGVEVVHRRPLAGIGALAGVWASSLLVYAIPGRMGRLWARTSLWAASLVFTLNAALTVGWVWFIAVCYDCWSNNRLRAAPLEPLHPHWINAFLNDFKLLGKLANEFWMPLQLIDHIAAVVGLFVASIGFLMICFFILLPFAARPGSNRACIRHVSRGVLLSSGLVHIASPLIGGFYLFLVAIRVEFIERWLSVLLIGSIMGTIWALRCLIRALRVEYRVADDMPTSHDPWCEICGYNLCATSGDGRCPECGTPVEASAGKLTRMLLPWEEEQSMGRRMRTASKHIFEMVMNPRRLFFRMPTLQGQLPAQRWMLMAVTLTGLCATLILPAFTIVGLMETDWVINLVARSMTVGLVWALMAMMMVGIETAGVAIFSRMRAKERDGPEGIFLATSAKVTCYASVLMPPWVVLGGMQLLVAWYWWDRHLSTRFHFSTRTEQVVLAVTLAVAHIGGLLWYELTVYRGIRAIQFANK